MTQPDRLTIEEVMDCMRYYATTKQPDVSLHQVAQQLLDTMRENEHMKMRLAQIASGDYKACGHTAEDVARDAFRYSNKDTDIPTIKCAWIGDKYFPEHDSSQNTEDK
jgi:hypothetical protein